MLLLTVILGVIGTIAALAGVWNLFLDWLNILGVFVPPIGAVILTDYALNHLDADLRWMATTAARLTTLTAEVDTA